MVIKIYILQNDYGKTYTSFQEERFRFKIFQQKLREIESHNTRYEQGQETFMKGVTQYSDLAEGEILKEFSMPIFHPVEPSGMFYASAEYDPKPTVDWREKAVLDIHDQGECGSCWAFSTVS